MTTQILVVTKLDVKKDFILKGLILLSSVPARNLLFRVSNWGTRIRYENCSRLRIKTLNDINDVVLVSNYWLWTGKRLLGSYFQKVPSGQKIL